MGSAKKQSMHTANKYDNGLKSKHAHKNVQNITGIKVGIISNYKLSLRLSPLHNDWIQSGPCFTLNTFTPTTLENTKNNNKPETFSWDIKRSGEDVDLFTVNHQCFSQCRIIGLFQWSSAAKSFEPGIM